MHGHVPLARSTSGRSILKRDRNSVRGARVGTRWITQHDVGPPMEPGGLMQRQRSTLSPGRAGSAAVMVGGLLLAGLAVSRVFKSTPNARSAEQNGAQHDPTEPPPDPELGAWG